MKPLSVTHDLSHAPGYACAHRMVFAEPVTREQAMAYVEAEHYFGYDPAGYGGFLEPDQYRGDEPRTEWTWRHSRSCD